MKYNKRDLYNTKGKAELKERLNSEPFERITTSFYKYTELINPEEVRDELYLKFRNLKVLGRIYISVEGINAQLSVHSFCLEARGPRNLFFSSRVWNLP